MDRIFLLFRTISRQVKTSIHPSSVSEVKIGSHIIKDEDVFPHILFIAMYILLILLSVLLVLLLGGDNGNALNGVISSLSNIGLSFGDISSHYNAEPMVAKFIYTLDMFLGRIEIYPVLAVFSLMAGHNKRK